VLDDGVFAALVGDHGWCVELQGNILSVRLPAVGYAQDEYGYFLLPQFVDDPIVALAYPPETFELALQSGPGCGVIRKVINPFNYSLSCRGVNLSYGLERATLDLN
jgi:hypothetical protein